MRDMRDDDNSVRALTSICLTQCFAAAGGFAAAAAGIVGCGWPGAHGRIPGRLLGPSAALGHRLRDHAFPPPTGIREVQVVIAGAGVAGLAAATAVLIDTTCAVRDTVAVLLGSLPAQPAKASSAQAAAAVSNREQGREREPRRRVLATSRQPITSPAPD